MVLDLGMDGVGPSKCGHGGESGGGVLRYRLRGVRELRQ
jgi:hypothetical protein